jgi:hypothetical protein
MKTATLQEIIRQNIRLPNRANGRGFYAVLCKVCHDHGKKGPRAGFKFEGDTVGYNCFNCGHSAIFDPREHRTMPKKMAEVLSAFGIAQSDWNQVLFTALVNEHNGVTRDAVSTFVSIEPDKIPFATFFQRLEDNDNEWNQYAIQYLTQRGVDWKAYPFHICNEPDSHPDCERWYGRLIIPIYKDDKLIFFQGRDLSGLRSKKYMSPNVNRDNVLYGFDRLFNDADEPLYVVEGWFDAFMLDGVAVFGNHMTPAQIKWLNQSRRNKVIIPDRFGDGHLLAEQAIELGWSVSYPDIGSCKDVNESVMKYGKLYTLKTIREQTCEGFEAQAKMGVYCVIEPKKKKGST